MSLLEKASDQKKNQLQYELESNSDSNKVESKSKPSLLQKAKSFLSDELPKSLASIKPKGLLAKAEKIIETDEKLKDEILEEPPKVDEFDIWEDEAKEASIKAPINPISQDDLTSKKDYLFDDESDFTTAPIEYHLASKKKIENYHSIFEITKEIGSSSSFDDFFSNLNYSILGQVGAETLAIFSSTNANYDKLDLVESHGFEPTDDWKLTSNDPVYNIVSDQDSVLYANELFNLNINKEEREMLLAIQAEVLVPIRTINKFYGIIILGKMINGEEYIADDLEFIKVMADIAASVFERVTEFEARAKEIERLNKIISFNNTILNSAHQMADIRKLDQAYDELLNVMRDKFGVERFTFLIFDPEEKDQYKVFSSNQLSPSSINSFLLKRRSDIIGMVSNIMGVYPLDHFKENMELQSILSNDELGIMEDFIIIPLINLNWLVGLFIVHKSKTKLTDDTKQTIISLFEIVSPIFANILILQEKENSFRNPFSPIEDRVEAEIAKADTLHTTFTSIVFKVQNIPRMIQILGQQVFAEYCDSLRKSILEHLGENDHYVRVGQGKFSAILHAKDKDESEIVIRKIKNNFQPVADSFKGSFKPSFRILSLEYPKDTKIKEQIIEMIEEA
jgi:transcriptional regulator with GAF, ATPase, and Fis domain